MQKKLISKIGDWLLASLRSAAIGRTSTVVRGVLWAAAWVFAQSGYATPEENAVTKVVEWVVGAALAMLATWWSMSKDKWLREQPPEPAPKSSDPSSGAYL